MEENLPLQFLACLLIAIITIFPQIKFFEWASH